MIYKKFSNIFTALLLLTSVNFINGSFLPNNKNVVQREFSLYNDIIDSDKYKVKYEVNLASKIITFEVEVETKGYVGFGISPGKGMAGADIVIGGVLPNGTTYFTDRYAESESLPKEDEEKNWDLIESTENGTHTYLKFSRLLDTCDKKHDVPITDDTISIIWSFGLTDEIEHHGANKGSSQINFLDPSLEVDTSHFETWSLNRTMEMPNKTTSYWCTIHKAPNFEQKHHIVGFNTKLETPEALKHTHHLAMYQCTAPPGVDADELFGKLADTKGGECYEKDQVIPTDYCRTTLNTWAVGGKPMFLPEQAGYSLSENISESVYIMYEIHYDNPEAIAGLTITSIVEVYHTTNLRQHEASMLLVDHSITFSLMIPGSTSNFVSVGHCTSECTSRTLDDKGINLVNVLLHSHLLGKKLKLRHFRDEKELPWVTADNNYAFDYQQNRPLREERNIKKGDHLTVECTSDSSNKTKATLGGLSTNEEMCQAIIWYYPKSDLRYCQSAYAEWEFMWRFEIESMLWENVLDVPIVLEPEQWAGQSLVDVLTKKMSDWTPAQRAQLQHDLRFTKHYEVSCGPDPFPPEEDKKRRAANWKAEPWVPPPTIGYPEIDEEYAPEDVCKSGTAPGATHIFANMQFLVITMSTLILSYFTP